jgi:hypothetical protein
MRHALGILRRGLLWQLLPLCCSSVGFSQAYQFTVIKAPPTKGVDLDAVSINDAGKILASYRPTLSKGGQPRRCPLDWSDRDDRNQFSDEPIGRLLQIP